MKKVNKLVLLSSALFAFAWMHGADEAVDNEIEWPTHSTQEYIYNKVLSSKPATNKVERSEDIKISNHTFDTGLTRTKVTVEPIGEKVQTTTETWTTANPSYVTLLNGVIAFNTPYIGSAIDKGIGLVRFPRTIGNLTHYKFFAPSSDLGSYYESESFAEQLWIQLSFTINRAVKDPIIATAIVGGTAYYLYQQYLNSQKAAQEKAAQEKAEKESQELENSSEQSAAENQNQ